jgi:hypothetical protein
MNKSALAAVYFPEYLYAPIQEPRIRVYQPLHEAGGHVSLYRYLEKQWVTADYSRAVPPCGPERKMSPVALTATSRPRIGSAASMTIFIR